MSAHKGRCFRQLRRTKHRKAKPGNALRSIKARLQPQVVPMSKTSPDLLIVGQVVPAAKALDALLAKPIFRRA